MRKPIMVTGCQRSGTTLVRLILDSHPKISSIDEDQFRFPELYSYLYANYSPSIPFIAFKLPIYAHLISFIETLPERRLLWCIRNPLDVVWSMIKLQMPMGGILVPWAAHPGGGWAEISNTYWALGDEQKKNLKSHMADFWGLTEKFANIAKSPEKLAKNLANIDRRHCVFIAALCWRIKNELLQVYVKHGIDFHLIRYIDLVTHPRERIAEMLDYIGIDWNEEVMQHHSLHKGVSIGNTSNSRAIDQDSLGKGAKNLTHEEQESIKAICRPIAQQWDYLVN